MSELANSTDQTSSSFTRLLVLSYYSLFRVWVKLKLKLSSIWIYAHVLLVNPVQTVVVGEEGGLLLGDLELLEIKGICF